MANEQRESTPETTRTHLPFTAWTVTKLAEPLNPSRIVEDRQGNPYLEGWDVIAAANHDFGFDGWRSEIVSLESGARFTAERGNDRHLADLYVYTARIRVTAGGVSHEDVGTSPTATDSPEAHETAIKACVTDGLKRALRQFGSQFGNDLYDKGRSGGGGYGEAEQAQRPQPQVAPQEAREPARATERVTTSGEKRNGVLAPPDHLENAGGLMQYGRFHHNLSGHEIALLFGLPGAGSLATHGKDSYMGDFDVMAEMMEVKLGERE